MTGQSKKRKKSEKLSPPNAHFFHLKPEAAPWSTPHDHIRSPFTWKNNICICIPNNRIFSIYFPLHNNELKTNLNHKSYFGGEAIELGKLKKQLFAKFAKVSAWKKIIQKHRRRWCFCLWYGSAFSVSQFLRSAVYTF